MDLSYSIILITFVYCMSISPPSYSLGITATATAGVILNSHINNANMQYCTHSIPTKRFYSCIVFNDIHQ